MSKMFEALRHAQKEIKEVKGIEKIAPRAAHRPLPVTSPLGEETEQKKALLSLYQRIDSLLPHAPRKVIQFIGSRSGEGASTITREFGRMAANTLNKSVLILDADQQNPQQHVFARLTPQCGWEDLLNNGGDIDAVVYRANGSNLSVCPVSPNVVMSHHVFDSPKIVDLWKTLRKRFDLVIVDSPPASESSDGIALSRNVDGVVLVLEAEKTRWPVAQKTKETIEKNGGKLLGIVFNKRQFYIPEFVYRRL